MCAVAFRSVRSPPQGYITKEAPNLQVLAAAAYRLLKCGGVAKNNTKSKLRVVYELYPPDDVSNEKWFCHFIKNIDSNTFLGRWCLANSTFVLDRKYARPVVFEWCTVKCRVH